MLSIKSRELLAKIIQVLFGILGVSLAMYGILTFSTLFLLAGGGVCITGVIGSWLLRRRSKAV
jgi:uncharacterized membrane protein